MKALEAPDSFRVEAARSLLEEGKHVAAREELERVTAGMRSHPDVLEVRWGIEAQTGNWPVSLEVAESLIAVAPERPSGWIKRSYVLHRLKRSKEALDGLFAVVGRFPDIPIIAYNLACYAAELGHDWEAQRWLKKALETGGEEYKKMALVDRELVDLWAWLEGQKVAEKKG